MTAPAFFRSNVGDQVAAGFGGPDVPLVLDWGNTFAEDSGQSIQFSAIVGGPNIVITGMATADWEDLDNPIPTPPAIGTEAISGNTTSQLAASFPGFIPGLQHVAGTQTVAGGNYVLADTASTSTSPITLVETYQAHYVAAAGPVFQSNVVLTFNSTSIGGTLTLNGNGTGFTQFVLPGSMPQATGGTVTTTLATGSTFSISSSSSTVLVTITTIFPAGVPVAGATTNPPAGVAWNVGMFNQHNLGYFGAGAPGGATALSSVATHYAADFYA